METGAGQPDIDVARGRWEFARAREGLIDPGDGEFGNGGLARLLGEERSRLLIMPGDPEAHVVDFDDELWEWWGADFAEPVTGRETQWGHDKLPTAAAAVFGSNYGESEWRRYIALHHGGTLEVGIGGDGSGTWEDRRLFWLSPIMARCWVALARYGDVVDRFALAPPHELSLALCGTQGALIGGFAEGWAEPGRMEYVTDPCEEQNVLLRREFADWPGTDLVQVAFSLGAQIEDAWGTKQRRFLAARDDHTGEFDPRTAAWR